MYQKKRNGSKPSKIHLSNANPTVPILDAKSRNHSDYGDSFDLDSLNRFNKESRSKYSTSHRLALVLNQSRMESTKTNDAVPSSDLSLKVIEQTNDDVPNGKSDPETAKISPSPVVVEKKKKEKSKTVAASTVDKEVDRKETKSRFDMKFQAESILSSEGTKAISKCIESGNMNTAVFQAIAKLATEQGIKLRIKDSINKYFNFTPLLRSLHTIFPDLRYNKDILFFTAVREGEIPAVEYLLLHGNVDPLCRNGECLIEAYVERNNASLTRLMLDYVKEDKTSSAYFPPEVIEAAQIRKDFHLVRQLLCKGSCLSDEMLNAWMQSDTFQWDQMRLFTRFQPQHVFRFQQGAIVKLCLVNISTLDVKEQNERREMFSLFISKGANPVDFLTDIDQSTIDDFVKLMMSETTQGLFKQILPNSQTPVASEEGTKKRKQQQD